MFFYLENYGTMEDDGFKGGSSGAEFRRNH